MDGWKRVVRLLGDLFFLALVLSILFLPFIL
jgi:hypothetical protein